MAFQITDDLLDYTAPARVTGKPSGQDLREHKVTLPLIAALPRLDDDERQAVETLFDEPEPSEGMVAEVVEIVERRGGLEHAREQAAEFVAGARRRLEALPGGAAVDSLARAAEFVERRRS